MDYLKILIFFTLFSFTLQAQDSLKVHKQIDHSFTSDLNIDLDGNILIANDLKFGIEFEISIDGKIWEIYKLGALKGLRLSTKRIKTYTFRIRTGPKKIHRCVLRNNHKYAIIYDEYNEAYTIKRVRFD